MTPITKSPTVEDYARVFYAEQSQSYPVVEAVEVRAGFALDRGKLEDAARVLACPVKNNPPNWQHGRVLYALATRYLSDHVASAPFSLLDIGTAKGFSALCLRWALEMAGVAGHIVSVDVIDPRSHARRNTVAECHESKTLFEVLAPWPEAADIEFRHQTGIDYLSESDDRIHVAFVDGKHDERVVAQEAQLLAGRQAPGDLAIFDDVHIPGVWASVSAAKGYEIERVQLLNHRAYAVAVRR